MKKKIGLLAGCVGAAILAGCCCGCSSDCMIVEENGCCGGKPGCKTTCTTKSSMKRHKNHAPAMKQGTKGAECSMKQPAPAAKPTASCPSGTVAQP